MRHQITDYEFGQLKHFFDQNDLFGGAAFFNQLLEQWQEDLYKKDYNGEMLYHLPFECGEGIEMEYDQNNTNNKPVLRVNPETVEWEDYAKTIDELLNRIHALEIMHKPEGDHVPKIISTKEQYEEMKPQMDEKERVLVHTTFDKALNVL